MAIRLVFGVIVALIAWQVALRVFAWFGDHPIIAAVAILALIFLMYAAVAGVLEERRERQERLANLRFEKCEIDDMDGTAFELACRDLMRRDGLSAEHVGGSNDQEADVIGRSPDGRVVVMQCKHRKARTNLSVRVLYSVNGTAVPVHHADVVIVATNQGFTARAREWAPRHGIHLLDREKLLLWARDGHTLWTVLGVAAPPAPRRSDVPPARHQLTEPE